MQVVVRNEHAKESQTKKREAGHAKRRKGGNSYRCLRYKWVKKKAPCQVPQPPQEAMPLTVVPLNVGFAVSSMCSASRHQ